MYQLGVEHTFTPDYPPESDSPEWKDVSKCWAMSWGVMTDTKNALRADNSIVHSIIGISLYKAIYGRAITLPGDMTFLEKSGGKFPPFFRELWIEIQGHA